MYRVPTMAKINIFCYAHNRFRVSKGYTYAQSLVYCTVSHFLYFPGQFARTLSEQS